MIHIEEDKKTQSNDKLIIYKEIEMWESIKENHINLT